MQQKIKTLSKNVYYYCKSMLNQTEVKKNLPSDYQQDKFGRELTKQEIWKGLKVVDGKIRQSTNIYSRVMGYFAPLKQFNTGKKSEFISRKYYTEAVATANKRFCEENKEGA